MHWNTMEGRGGFPCTAPTIPSTSAAGNMIKNKTDREAECTSASCVREVGEIHGFPVTCQEPVGK